MSNVKASASSEVQALCAEVDFSLCGPLLGPELEGALQDALDRGAVFNGLATPREIFRRALASSLRAIEDDPRGALFQRFLRPGPYWDEGDIPPEAAGLCLSDGETADAVSFVFSRMINRFKGDLAELLAVRPCLDVLDSLKAAGLADPGTRLYAFDTARALNAKGTRRLLGSDMYLLGEGKEGALTLEGVVEVKSYPCAQDKLQRQLASHAARAGRGLSFDGAVRRVRERAGGAALIAVQPSLWTLPRTFRFEKTLRGRDLWIDPPQSPSQADRIERTGTESWNVTLRWSREALAEAAFNMTYWYMEKVGEVVYARDLPENWKEMTPAEAGANAAKQALYYAILRARNQYENSRAVALYNAYGFGYALGTSFRDSRRRRQMLWPEDLDEILAHGKSRDGCRLWDF